MGYIFEKACMYALEKHKNQMRKDGTMYIFHPLEVATIASTMTNDEEVLAASVLHDTIEDANSNTHELNEMFGEKVAKLVALETEETYPNLSKVESWILRKKKALTIVSV